MIKSAEARKRASFAIADRKKKDQQKLEADKKSASRKASDDRAAQQRAEHAKRIEARKVEERKKAAIRKEFNRKAVETRETERRKAAQKQKGVALRQFKRAVRPVTAKPARKDQAALEVAADFKRQRTDQRYEHRRQTSRLRTQHKWETVSMRANENKAVDRHWHAVKRIDAAEQRALSEFDQQRSGLKGRVVATFKGRKAVERAREGIKERFESERMTKHRDLEALKEKQFTAAQGQLQKQARERKDMMDGHRAEVKAMEKTQERLRPRLEAQLRFTMAKTREQARENVRETSREKSLTNDFSLSSRSR